MLHKLPDYRHVLPQLALEPSSSVISTIKAFLAKMLDISAGLSTRLPSAEKAAVSSKWWGAKVRAPAGKGAGSYAVPSAMQFHLPFPRKSVTQVWFCNIKLKGNATVSGFFFLTVFYLSQNHRMTCVGRNLKDHAIPTRCCGQGCPPLALD